MSARRDPEEVAKEILAESEKLLAQVEERINQSDQFFASLGIERGAFARYLESDKVPQAEREKAKRELAQWQEEVERDIRRAQDEARGSTQKAPTLRPGFMRI